MEFTENLKKKLGEAQTEEEVEEIIGETKKKVEAAGVILDDADLDEATGGAARGLPGGSKATSDKYKNHKYPWQ